jgi:hypothetical protein
MIAYLRQRLPLRVFLTASVLLGLAAQATSGFDPTRWLMDAGLAFLLLAQFRLWDDLADRDRDSRAHPERVLVRTPHVMRFVSACLLLASANLVASATFGGADSLAILLGLNLAAATWYMMRPGRPTIADEAILSLKYPAFVWILSEPRAAGLTLVLIATYLSACWYQEWRDNRRSAVSS